jgi:hypothetical protein
VKTIELEELVASTILSFCENLAELGCPRKEKEPDMWYRNLSWDGQKKVADKLMTIVERDAKRFESNKSSKKSKKLKKAKKKEVRPVIKEVDENDGGGWK